MSILGKYYRINKAAGVSIRMDATGQSMIQACTVSVNGDQLTIDKKLTGLQTIEQLKLELPAKSVIALNLAGKGILQKQVEATETIDQSNFNQILPNANADDFYIQNFISGSSSFVSVIRKTEAEAWINRLGDAGFKPLMLSLGPFPVESIIGQLNSYESDLVIDGNIISRDEHGAWKAAHHKESAAAPFPVKVDTEKIDDKLVIPYASAFQLIMADHIEPVCAQVDSLASELQKKLADNKIKVQGVIILALLFTLLLANFITFSWLNSVNAKLVDQVGRYTQSANDNQNIKEQIRQKENKLKILGWDGGINKSSLIDQVAALLPQGVKLSEIVINPIDQSGSRVQKSLMFFDRRIQVTGFSQSIMPVNEWIARIKTKRGVKNIQIESYSYDSEQNTGRFLLIINY